VKITALNFLKCTAGVCSRTKLHAYWRNFHAVQSYSRHAEINSATTLIFPSFANAANDHNRHVLPFFTSRAAPPMFSMRSAGCAGVPRKPRPCRGALCSAVRRPVRPASLLFDARVLANANLASEQHCFITMLRKPGLRSDHNVLSQPAIVADGTRLSIFVPRPMRVRERSRSMVLLAHSTSSSMTNCRPEEFFFVAAALASRNIRAIAS